MIGYDGHAVPAKAEEGIVIIARPSPQLARLLPCLSYLSEQDRGPEARDDERDGQAHGHDEVREARESPQRSG